MPPSTRERLVTATTELFRRQGDHGTSLAQVTGAAGAPTGSLYHHFPGGKNELTAAVLDTSGAAYRLLFEAIWDEAPGPAEAVSAFFDGAAEVLEATDFIDPCPIGSVAREVASTNDELRLVAHAVFTSWVASATERLVAAGLDADTAADLAVALVAAVEGGFVLARTACDGEVLRRTGRRMRSLVEADLAAEAARSERTRR